MKERRSRIRRGKKALSDEVITKCVNRMIEHLVNDIRWEQKQEDKNKEKKND